VLLKRLAFTALFFGHVALGRTVLIFETVGSLVGVVAIFPSFTLAEIIFIGVVIVKDVVSGFTTNLALTTTLLIVVATRSCFTPIRAGHGVNVMKLAERGLLVTQWECESLLGLDVLGILENPCNIEVVREVSARELGTFFKDAVSTGVVILLGINDVIVSATADPTVENIA